MRGRWGGSGCGECVVRWRLQGVLDLRVSVTVSPRHFTRSDAAKTVTDALDESGLGPYALELEITQSLMLGEGDRAARALPALRSIGMTLALDDFGTGYSSLNFVTRFPVDVLKIDRSFVGDVARDANSDLRIVVRDAPKTPAARLRVEALEETADVVLGSARPAFARLLVSTCARWVNS